MAWLGSFEEFLDRFERENERDESNFGPSIIPNECPAIIDTQDEFPEGDIPEKELGDQSTNIRVSSYYESEGVSGQRMISSSMVSFLPTTRSKSKTQKVLEDEVIVDKDPASVLTEEDLDNIRVEFRIPQEIEMRISGSSESASYEFPGWTVVYAISLRCGLSLNFGLHEFLVAYSWQENKKDVGRYMLSKKDKENLIVGTTSSDHNWQKRYFLVKKETLLEDDDAIPSSWTIQGPHMAPRVIVPLSLKEIAEKKKVQKSSKEKRTKRKHESILGLHSELGTIAEVTETSEIPEGDIDGDSTLIRKKKIRVSSPSPVGESAGLSKEADDIIQVPDDELRLSGDDLPSSLSARSFEMSIPNIPLYSRPAELFPDLHKLAYPLGFTPPKLTLEDASIYSISHVFQLYIDKEVEKLSEEVKLRMEAEAQLEKTKNAASEALKKAEDKFDELDRRHIALKTDFTDQGRQLSNIIQQQKVTEEELSAFKIKFQENEILLKDLQEVGSNLKDCEIELSASIEKANQLLDELTESKEDVDFYKGECALAAGKERIKALGEVMMHYKAGTLKEEEVHRMIKEYEEFKVIDATQTSASEAEDDV
ncbi:uncharacterized protein LOC119991489 [Tripterygium wilfordii]|uniref:uncharacterized protein LOC119991489 n=1 Tax=Tripterygium wilfordii TaxID=458696 RepID=UPI0018F82168|nr:uncharacterized protein LOC119991489 [Tripterygium wilfordii]